MSTFTLEEAIDIGERIGIDWEEVDFTHESFLKGLEVELEHGTELGEETNVTEDDPEMTGQIAWAHLIEDPDYYELLEEMEAGFDGERTMDRSEGATYRRGEGIYNTTKLPNVKKRESYVLDIDVEKGLTELSPEVFALAKNFVKKAKNAAESLAPREENPAEHLEYVKDFLSERPSLGRISASDLATMLLQNPILGAIPLKELRAEELLRGEDIDVYDYLQASLELVVSEASKKVMNELAQKEMKELQGREEMPASEEEGYGFEKETVVHVPKGASAVIIGEFVYRKSNVFEEQELLSDIEHAEAELDHVDSLYEAGRIDYETYHDRSQELYEDLKWLGREFENLKRQSFRG